MIDIPDMAQMDKELAELADRREPYHRTCPKCAVMMKLRLHERALAGLLRQDQTDKRVIAAKAILLRQIEALEMEAGERR